MIVANGRGSVLSPRPFVTAILAIACLTILGAGVATPAPSLFGPSTTADGESGAPGGLQSDEAIHPMLAEAIGFYTGSGGIVDDQRAHDRMIEAVASGDLLSPPGSSTTFVPGPKRGTTRQRS